MHKALFLFFSFMNSNFKSIETIHRFITNIQKVKNLNSLIQLLKMIFKNNFEIQNMAFFYFPEVDSEYLIQNSNFYSKNLSKNHLLKLKKIQSEVKFLESTNSLFETNKNEFFKFAIGFKSHKKILAFLLIDEINSSIQEYQQELEIISTTAGAYLEIQQLKKIAMKDAKTDLYNYRYFRMCIKKEIEFCKSAKQKFSVLFLDLDNFKKLNDKHGHITGDIILMELSTYLKKTSPKTKVLARYGGDEFCILYKNSIEESFVFAKNLQSNFEKQKLLSKYFSSININLTLSIGMSEYKSSDLHENEIIERADNALYKAKLCGKSQICIL